MVSGWLTCTLFEGTCLRGSISALSGGITFYGRVVAVVHLHVVGVTGGYSERRRVVERRVLLYGDGVLGLLGSDAHRRYGVAGRPHRLRGVEQLRRRQISDASHLRGVRGVDGEVPRLDDLAAFSDLVFEQVGPVNSFSGVLYEHPANEHFDSLWDWEGDPEFFGLEDLYELGDGVGLKRTLAKNHLKKDDPEGPDVGLHGVDFALDDLGSHINRRAQHRLREISRTF